MQHIKLILLLLIFPVSVAMAQKGKPQLGEKFPGFLKVKVEDKKGPPDLVLQKLLKLKPWEELRQAGVFTDEIGYTHSAFQQYYRGLKVDGARVKTHAKDGEVLLISGNRRDIFKEVSTTPSYSRADALNTAFQYVGAYRYDWQEGGEFPEGELVIVADPDAREEPRLAYKFDMYALDPLYRAFVYIDAHNGTFLKENERIHHADVPASGNSLYNGNVTFTADNASGPYRLRQTADGGGIQTFTMNNGTSYYAATDITSSSTSFIGKETGVQAHWGAEQTHKYYFQKHNRNSYNGAGAVIKSYVSYGSNYSNAFWDGQRMTYGDGNGTTYSPLVSLDVVGHELTHGVTDYAANLVYSYESGALNESFSDIFGEAIERFATGTNDWEIGAEIFINGGKIRSMANPNAKGDPDTYLGTYWYTGTNDHGGVHTNSGVQNKWFYILTKGENGINDLGNSYSVSGIGMDKAAAIAYRNLTVYLSSTSDYFDARVGAIQAAKDLYGNGSPEMIATTNAWYAVGVGDPYAEGQISYCVTRGTDYSYEWIGQVKTGNLDNASGASGYSDFSSMIVDVSAGQSVGITLVPAFATYTYEEWWRVWIDYNKDGDFDDPGELAFDAGGLSATAVTGTINIPPNADGQTRMRVSMKYNSAPDPCETFVYGEVEDYTIRFSGGGSSPLEVAITGASNISCFGANDGAVTANATGGTPPYNYIWNNGQTGSSINNLAGGTYIVTVTDAASPVASSTVSVTIEEPPAISITINKGDVSCGSADNGWVSASGTGGTGSLSYRWSRPDGGTVNSSSMSGLSAGLYQLTVTDANGCQTFGSTTIQDFNYTYFADNDNDGYGDPENTIRACSPPSGYVSNYGDCNDNNSQVHPGATEICDGVDNDCDGSIDEGLGQNVYYQDRDSDGYGDGSSWTTACVRPNGYTTISGDCNDYNNKVYPGAAEICDGIDNDCDGLVDEGASLILYYADNDGDTYGDPANSLLSCNRPSGYVTNSGDCNDNDPAINPGATEVCDGVDNDCDGTIDEGCTGASTILAHYFETGWDGWEDGGSDCHRLSSTRAYEGSYAIRLRDNSGTESSMTSSSYNVSNYTQLEIEFFFYASSMENGESVLLRYYDGMAWQTISTYASGTDFSNGNFYRALVSVSSSNYNFPGNARFRIQCNASSNGDVVYIDAVTVKGSGAGLLSVDPGSISLEEVKEIAVVPFEESGQARTAKPTEGFGLQVFPVPAQDKLNVMSSSGKVESMRIFTVNGVLLRNMEVIDQLQEVDISTLPAGVYFLSVKTEEGIQTQKFVKQ